MIEYITCYDEIREILAIKSFVYLYYMSANRLYMKSSYLPLSPPPHLMMCNCSQVNCQNNYWYCKTNLHTTMNIEKRLEFMIFI